MASRSRIDELRSVRTSFVHALPPSDSDHAGTSGASPSIGVSQSLLEESPETALWKSQKEAIVADLKSIAAMIAEAQAQLEADYAYRLPSLGDGDDGGAQSADRMDHIIFPRLAGCRAKIEAIAGHHKSGSSRQSDPLRLLQAAVQSALAARLAALADSYKQVQSVYWNHAATGQPQYRHAGAASTAYLSPAGNAETPSQHEDHQLLHEEQRRNSDALSRTILQERHAGIATMHTQMSAVKDIMTHMNILALQQGGKLQRIDENLEAAEALIGKGGREVERKAQAVRRKQRKIVLAAMLVVILVLIVVLSTR